MSQWGTPCSASAFPDASSFYLLIRLRCTSLSPQMAQRWQSSIIKLVRSRSLIHVKITAFLLSYAAPMCLCMCAGLGRRRLGLNDRRVRRRHLNSWELHPAIPLLQWLLGLRHFSIFPDRRSLGIWLSNQRGPAVLLIYDLESQHSNGPIHHLHPSFFVVFTPPSCLVKNLSLFFSPPVF